MASPSIVEWIQLLCLLVSVPLYIWFIATIIRNRKVPPFSGSFFSLCLGLGLSDGLCLLSNWIVKFRKFEWFGMRYLSDRHENGLTKLYAFLMVHGMLGQWTGVAALALNRYTAVLHHVKYELIWDTKIVLFVTGCQLGAPLVLTVPLLAFDGYTFSPIDNETGLGGVVQWPKRSLQVFYGTIAFIYIWVVNLLASGLYGKMFITIRKRNAVKAGTTAATGQKDLLQKAEVNLSLIGLTLSVLLLLYSILMFKITMDTVAQAVIPLYMVMWEVLSDVFSWCNPWLCLCFSTPVREKMLGVKKPKTKQLAIRKPKPGSDRRNIANTKINAGSAGPGLRAN